MDVTRRDVIELGIAVALVGVAAVGHFADATPVLAFGLAALAIAVFKATLVVLFFMHVKYSTRLTWAVVAGGIFWLGILLVLTMGDYLTRGWRTYG